MEILGTIEELIFKNSDNGYTVAVLSYADLGVNKYVTITGVLPDIHIGETVKLYGDYTNTKYGEQFAFVDAEITNPTTLQGIKKYLSSGLIKGVGPITAELIVEEFKKSALDVIEYNPEMLIKVHGISKRKAMLIHESFNNVKKMQNVIIFLQKYNISINMALKIYNIYGDKTIEVIKNNPYILIEDIKGIGFLSADKIANSMGIEKNSIFRIRAGFLYCIDENSEKLGNTYILKNILLKNNAELLGLDLESNIDKFELALNGLSNEKTVMIFRNNSGAEIVMATSLYFIENTVAQKLALLTISKEVTKCDVSDEILMFEKINNIKFDENQKLAIKNSIEKGVSVITGGPGTGKTTIIKCIIEILEQQGNKVLLLAPTGRASKRLSESTLREAKTIHRGLNVNIKGDKTYFSHNESNPLNFDVIIVDEVSMVDVTLMSHLLKAIKRDSKLILVGDKDQLPSVSAGNVLDDIIKSNLIPVSYLTKIFRQNEKSLIVSNAHLINNGLMPVIDNSSNDFFFELKNDNFDIKNSIIEMVTKRIPKFAKTDATKIQVLAPLKAGASGVETLNTELQQKLNPPSHTKQEIMVGKTIFREGDKVMQTVNNYDLSWQRIVDDIMEEGQGIFNGDIGYIHKIDLSTNEIIIWFEDGRECIYSRADILELVLAYAITIHKSQGSEFDIVVIPIISGPSLILTRNLIYTAVTRAKNMVVLVGSKRNLHRMVANSYTVQRYTLLKDFLINSYEKLKLMYQ